MRYQLLHYSSFVPVLVRIITDNWVLKCSWALYLFCCYIFLEQKTWNGYSLKTWHNFARLGEVITIFSINLPPTLSLLPWALLLRKETINTSVYSFACVAFVVFGRLSRLQCALAIVSVVAENFVKQRVHDEVTYHIAAQQRIAVRAIQIFTIVTSNKTLWYRFIMAVCMLLLKVIIYFNTDKANAEDIMSTDHSAFVKLRLRKYKSHNL